VTLVGRHSVHRLRGKTATAFLAHLTPSSVASLAYGDRSSATLSVLLNENGGIIDDLMITRQGEDKCVRVGRGVP
jgi:aminomethyltransferase